MSVAKLIVEVEGKSPTTRVFDDLRGDVDELADAISDAEAAASGGLNRKLYDVGEASGSAEQGFRGVADISGIMAEKLGLPLGPLSDNAAAIADLGGGIEGVLKGFPSLITGIGTMVGPLYAKAAAWWAVAAGVIAANAPLLITIGILALLVLGVILVIKHWDTITEKVPILGKAFDAVKAVIEKVADWFTGTLVEAIKDPQRALEGVLGFAKENWPEIATLLLLPFAPILILATDAFGIRSRLLGALDAMVTFTGEKAGEIVQWFADLPGRIIGAIGDVSNLLRGIGKSIALSLLNGLKDGFFAVKDEVGSWGGKIKDLKGPIEADRVLLEPEGLAIAAGLGKGLDSGFAQVLRNVANWSSQIKDEAAKAAPNPGSLTNVLAGASTAPFGGPALGDIGMTTRTHVGSGRTLYDATYGGHRVSGASSEQALVDAFARQGIIINFTGPLNVTNNGEQRDAQKTAEDVAFAITRAVRSRGGFVMA